MKRVISLVLALTLLVSLMGFGSFSVRAASNLKPSAEMVEIVKKLEGFNPKPYWDNSQYSVGYGTRPLTDEDLERYMKEGISEEEAETLLNYYLDKKAVAVNEFADRYGLTLTQGQFDAMLSLTYNCGTAWLTKQSTLVSSIVSGKTGSELLFAFGQWSNSAGKISRGLVRRRLIECNMYLNGIYSVSVPDNYQYIIYDNNGGTAEIKVQCFDANETVELYSVPTMEGYIFNGWYTQETGGEKLTTLSGIMGNPTVYAHWTLDTSEPPQETTKPEEGETDSGTLVTVTAMDVNLRTGPGTGYSVAGKANKGDQFTVTETEQGGAYLWGNTGKGWIALKYTDYVTPQPPAEEPPVTTPAPTEPPVTTPAPTEPPVTTPAPTEPSVTTPAPTEPPVTTPAPTEPPVTTPAPTEPPVTTPAPTEPPPVTTPAPTEPPVTAPAPTEPPVTQPPVTEPEDSESTGTSVTVTANDVNIRKGPGTSYSLAGKANKGDRFVVTQTQQGGGYLWGKISKGWIALKYTDYGKTQEEDKTEPVDPPKEEDSPAQKVMGTITADSLRIRKGPSTGYSTVGYLKKGDRVEILDRQTTGTTVWGKTSKGWISMDYVKLDEVEESPKEDTPDQPPVDDTPAAPPQEPAKVMGTITGNSLRIRSGAGIKYSIKGYLNKGDRVEILDQKTVGSMTWAKISRGWISMDYVKLDETVDSEKTMTGKVVSTARLTVRQGPSMSYAGVAILEPNTPVTIYQTKVIGSVQWGQVDKGWVLMDYIVLDGQTEESPEASVIRGTVTASALYIRQTAGMSGKILGSFPRGTKVEILQTRKVGSVVWGQTSQGWISMDYVKVSN